MHGVRYKAAWRPLERVTDQLATNQLRSNSPLPSSGALTSCRFASPSLPPLNTPARPPASTLYLSITLTNPRSSSNSSSGHGG